MSITNVQVLTTLSPASQPLHAAPLIQEVVATLTNAQMLTLFTVPVQLLPPPGVGKMYDVYRVVVMNDATAGAYSGVTSSFLLTYGSTGSVPFASVAQALIIGVTTRRITIIGPSSQGAISSSFDNLGLYALFASANPGGGNAANSCVVTLAYEIVSA